MAATPEHAARVLGLDDQATLEEIRDVRRALALKYHPDCSDDLERSTRHMARINAAADFLIAHLKGLGAKPKRPAYKDFSNQYKARRQRAEAKTSSQARKENASSRGEASAKNTRARQSMTVTAPEPQMPPQDRELIQFAVKSYRRVLDQIAKADSGPTVDVRALAEPVSG
ncbi:MAG: DnaJ domain-containing protein [Pseudomonadota bacterium]